MKNGGTVVATYMTGYVNENDLCYLGGFPAEELKDVFGIWAEDIDSLTDNMRNAAVTNEVFTKKSYEIIDYCELIHANTAEVLAEYGMDFYKGMPCLTKNSYGKGSAYYIAFRDNGDFLEDFYERLADELKLRRILKTPVPYGVYVSERENDSNRFIFIQNFNNEPKTVVLDGEYYDMEQEKTADTELNLERFGVKILKKPK